MSQQPTATLSLTPPLSSSPLSPSSALPSRTALHSPSVGVGGGGRARHPGKEKKILNIMKRFSSFICLIWLLFLLLLLLLLLNQQFAFFPPVNKLNGFTFGIDSFFSQFRFALERVFRLGVDQCSDSAVSQRIRKKQISHKWITNDSCWGLNPKQMNLPSSLHLWMKYKLTILAASSSCSN